MPKWPKIGFYQEKPKTGQSPELQLEDTIRATWLAPGSVSISAERNDQAKMLEKLTERNDQAKMLEKLTERNDQAKMLEKLTLRGVTRQGLDQTL